MNGLGECAAKMKFAGYQLLQDESVNSFALTASLAPLAVALQESGELLATFDEMPDELQFLFIASDERAGNLDDSLHCLRDLCSASLHAVHLASCSLKAARTLQETDSRNPSREKIKNRRQPSPAETSAGDQWSWRERIQRFVADPCDELLTEVSGVLTEVFQSMFQIAEILTPDEKKERPATMWDEVHEHLSRVRDAYDLGSEQVQRAILRTD